MQMQARRRIDRFFRAEGPYPRSAYPKHLAFFAAGGRHEPMPGCPPDCTGDPHNERAFVAGNRVGKTIVGAYEVTCHATGIYPSWWPGVRFEKPTFGWACGTTNTKVREIGQMELLGKIIREPGDRHDHAVGLGTGMIPADAIIAVKRHPGLADSIETAYIRHITGGTSEIGFRSYEQGRKAFEGTAQHWIWDDEEPPMDVYIEQRMRTMTVGGHILSTFTPLQGLSEVVLQFLPGGKAVQ